MPSVELTVCADGHTIAGGGGAVTVIENRFDRWPSGLVTCSVTVPACASVTVHRNEVLVTDDIVPDEATRPLVKFDPETVNVCGLMLTIAAGETPAICGAGGGATVTGKEQELVCAIASVTVHVIDAVPTANGLPDAGAHAVVTGVTPPLTVGAG